MKKKTGKGKGVSEWREVDIASADMQNESDFQFLGGLEELTDFGQVQVLNSQHSIQPKSSKKKKEKTSKKTAAVESESANKLKRKLSRSSDDAHETKNKLNKSKAKSEITDASLENQATTLKSAEKGEQNMKNDVWSQLEVTSPQIRQALADMKFEEPTEIQRYVLPAAIRDKMDIVGAAETGSGKTLAFGIPIIAGLLEAAQTENTKVHVGDSDGKEGEREITGPRAMILAPTRELAMQVKAHIQAVLKYTRLQVTCIVGGLSVQKQERLLKRQPEILVATPGRLWCLMKQPNPGTYLSNLSNIQYLVVDEADRLIEQGHFEELKLIVQKIKKESRQKLAQSFLFSATLSYVHPTPDRLKGERGTVQKTSEQKLEELMSAVRLRDKQVKIVDLTRQYGTAERIVETRINCDSLLDKDSVLCYFLRMYGGRSLVFTNSIDCARRLHGILTLMQLNPMILHARMIQKQRLKNLEKFTDAGQSVLLATDVAARGLDIQGIQHVIHYQVPRTAEVYVHRSGRTARANRSGVSVMLVDNTESHFYRRICHNLNKSEDLPLFPINAPKILAELKIRVRLATEIDTLNHRQRKQKASRGWLEKAAMEADIEIDRGNKDSDDEVNEIADKARQLKGLQNRLQQMHRTPLPSQSVICTKYPRADLLASMDDHESIDQQSIMNRFGTKASIDNRPNNMNQALNVAAGIEDKGKQTKKRLKQLGVKLGRVNLEAFKHKKKAKAKSKMRG